MVNARVRRDEVALGTLSLLKSELVRASKDSTAEGRIDDDLVVRVARKEVKRRQEAIDVYRASGDKAGEAHARRLRCRSCAPTCPRL